MCGIAGLFHLTGDSADIGIVRRMGELIAHRGPDDDDYLARGPVALGHRRLSIIDLSARGRNPIASEDDQFVLVANGEIYNHAELRSGLVARGHRFRSDTDTEVIVHLFEERGVDSVAELDGMFAFAVWNARERELTIARDRFGVKPLYYTQVGDVVAFASEIKAFLAVPGFSARPDAFALAEHLSFQNTFGERTLFAGVLLLPAGQSLTFTAQKRIRRRYWDLEFEPRAGDAAVWAAGIRQRFEAAVERQLMSEVPLGSYLSGGMDTGAITAVAARRLPSMHTFTCGFRLPEGRSELEAFFDERDESHRLAAGLGTVHHELELGPDAMIPALPTVVWHLDEPRVGISYQVYYTAEMIRRHVTVVLSGVGGDELFAGYPWRYLPLLEVGPDHFDDRLYRRASRLLQPEQLSGLFTHSVRHQLGDWTPRDSFLATMARAPVGANLHRAMYFDFKTFLNGLLIVDDKLSMAHSVEARVPFLDNELVEYARRIPAGLRLRGEQGKFVLRQAMRGLLPHEVVTRRKQGFTPPDRTWYKKDAYRYIRDLLLGHRATDRGYFEPAYLEKILDDHIEDRHNHRFLIWSLMCFEWWNRLFVDGEYPPARPGLVAEEIVRGRNEVTP
ncbi:MAG: asparagine synthase (glutamine-hydrolyzing) [Proteobacteria bacterium]|nr:asparagine synthase (glutamine-hydrolyzing) [Pseudomonadota bacterium]